MVKRIKRDINQEIDINQEGIRGGGKNENANKAASNLSTVSIMPQSYKDAPIHFEPIPPLPDLSYSIINNYYTI